MSTTPWNGSTLGLFLSEFLQNAICEDKPLGDYGPKRWWIGGGDNLLIEILLVRLRNETGRCFLSETTENEGLKLAQRSEGASK